MHSAHDGEGGPSEARLRELLDREIEEIQSKAAEHLAEQCRLLASLSMSVATAEAARERRFTELERDLREQIERAIPAAPEPLQIPRSSEAPRPSVTDLWSARDRRPR